MTSKYIFKCMCIYIYIYRSINIIIYNGKTLQMFLMQTGIMTEANADSKRWLDET